MIFFIAVAELFGLRVLEGIGCVGAGFVQITRIRPTEASSTEPATVLNSRKAGNVVAPIETLSHGY